MQNAVHFVRFDDDCGDHFWNARRVFGEPDFMHRRWDRRAQREVAPGDTIVFGKGDENQPIVEHNYDDSAYQ